MEQEKDWFEDVPKTELHVHLEGAIPLQTLWDLVQKYGGDPLVPSVEALSEKFTYRDFAGFIDTWVWKNSFLREYEDFASISEAVAQDFVRQNIRYAEVFYSPPDFTRSGLMAGRLTEAIRAGLSRVSGIEIKLVADLVRDSGLDRASRTLSELNEVQSLGVIGVGLGGSEQSFPAEPFEKVFERARRLGFHTTAHAGEAAGAASIWEAIRNLKVERIGHGTRAYEDESLVDFLAERHIPLEVCPISNLRTGVIPNLEEHPLRRYFQKGIHITINTDDPKMFQTSLAAEYRLLANTMGFCQEELRKLILQGVEACWAAPERKKELRHSFQNDPQW